MKNKERIEKRNKINRPRNYYRIQRIRHIKRKKRIVKSYNDYWYYKYDGQYSKGKIHCDCPKCSGNCKVHGWNWRDTCKIYKYEQDMKEYRIGDLEDFLHDSKVA